jgi:uncharacterized protein (TIGR00255 family)
MTGYGRGTVTSAGMNIEVELSSVNRKQFDLRLNLPRGLMSLESRLRDYVHDFISRGNITGIVRVGISENMQKRSVVINRSIASAYLDTIRKAARDLGIENDITAKSLIRLPEVIQYKDVLDDTDKVWTIMKKALKEAVSELVKMRETEGAALEKDLVSRLEKMECRLSRIRKYAPRVPVKHRELLKNKLKSAGVDSSENNMKALMREVVIFAERSDISEEIIRLDSHFKHTEKLMKSRKPVGRALDFICQEMFREINTIGSKANDREIAGQVIRFKTELESIREQVQNVE